MLSESQISFFAQALHNVRNRLTAFDWRIVLGLYDKDLNIEDLIMPYYTACVVKEAIIPAKVYFDAGVYHHIIGNLDQAFECYLQAVILEQDVFAMHALSFLLETYPMPDKRERLAEIYKILSAGNDSNAMYYLALMYLNQQIPPIESESPFITAKTLLVKASQNGMIYAYFQLAVLAVENLILIDDTPQKSHVSAKEFLELAVATDCIDAMTYLGTIYFSHYEASAIFNDEKNVQTDGVAFLQQSLFYLEQASTYGDPKAMYLWIAGYKALCKIKNIVPDALLIMQYLSNSADCAHIPAIREVCADKSVNSQTKQVAPFLDSKEDAPSLDILISLSKMGDVAASERCGQIFFYGEDTKNEKPDAIKALYFFQLAVSQGSQKALTWCAKIFYEGLASPDGKPDYANTLLYLELRITRGCEFSRKLREKMYACQQGNNEKDVSHLLELTWDWLLRDKIDLSVQTMLSFKKFPHFIINRFKTEICLKTLRSILQPTHCIYLLLNAVGVLPEADKHLEYLKRQRLTLVMGFLVPMASTAPISPDKKSSLTAFVKSPMFEPQILLKVMSFWMPTESTSIKFSM